MGGAHTGRRCRLGGLGGLGRGGWELLLLLVVVGVAAAAWW